MMRLRNIQLIPTPFGTFAGVEIVLIFAYVILLVVDNNRGMIEFDSIPSGVNLMKPPYHSVCTFDFRGKLSLDASDLDSIKAAYDEIQRLADTTAVVHIRIPDNWKYDQIIQIANVHHSPISIIRFYREQHYVIIYEEPPVLTM